MAESVQRPQVGAGAIVWRGDEVLLIKRGKPPRLGQWSIPGGRIELGETVEAAVHREVMEETGCTIEILGLCGIADSITEHGHIVLIDFTALLAEGEPRAGDDAADARFFPYDEINGLGMWEETERMIHLSRDHVLAMK